MLGLEFIAPSQAVPDLARPWFLLLLRARAPISHGHVPWCSSVVSLVASSPAPMAISPWIPPCSCPSLSRVSVPHVLEFPHTGPWLGSSPWPTYDFAFTKAPWPDSAQFVPSRSPLRAAVDFSAQRSCSPASVMLDSM